MKKMIAFAFVMMMVLSLGLASAKTLISGKIYNADYSKTVAGAYVEVSCDDGDITVKNVTSSSDGSYAVDFNERDCEAGDVLTVYASHPSYGANTKSGEIHDNYFGGSWDLAIVNVPLVPEFGFFVGMLTILSAIGVFFVVRRN